MLALAFPNIDPVLIQLGPFAIRWYALAYIAGIVVGWRWCLHLLDKPPKVMTRQEFDDFLLWATLGIVLGGRLGYVLFYRPSYYLENPLEALQVWHGGMSFHGGLLGVLLAIGLFARAKRVPYFALADVVACGVPFGLLFGRLANFINGELWGRVTDVPWAMVFPGGGPEPRHPSQLYQAAMEGVLLWLLLYVVERAGARHRVGLVSGVFMIGYGCARSIGELFRQPDSFMGFFAAGTTMGQLLSAPMILFGIYLIVRARRTREYA
ncbi:MAG: prolipoprotein diacylglyceryl transferase [Alphaproteobacteria bacterium]|nr:prolipoprotein diacylglyceryl transferase [Alphaproteobacteria bacterium]